MVFVLNKGGCVVNNVLSFFFGFGLFDLGDFRGFLSCCTKNAV